MWKLTRMGCAWDVGADEGRALQAVGNATINTTVNNPLAVLKSVAILSVGSWANCSSPATYEVKTHVHMGHLVDECWQGSATMRNSVG